MRAAMTLVLGISAMLVVTPVVRGGAAAEPVERGERLYRIHCLNCHGEEGRGDGPMSEVLKNDVPDLTRLAASHDGTFRRDRVMGSIDGRFAVTGHGMREMPIWGLSFQERGRDASREREVQQHLQDLTAYLESIQEKE